jgi:hypothetical protein
MSGEGAVFFLFYFPHCIFYLFSFLLFYFLSFYFYFILILTAINLWIFVPEKKIAVSF